MSQVMNSMRIFVLCFGQKSFLSRNIIFRQSLIPTPTLNTFPILPCVQGLFLSHQSFGFFPVWFYINLFLILNNLFFEMQM